MLLSASFQVVKRLFVLAYAIAANAGNNEAGIKDNKNYFFPRGKTENSNILIDGRSFYDQPINNLIKVRKSMKSEKYQKDMVMITLQDVY